MRAIWESQYNNKALSDRITELGTTISAGVLIGQGVIVTGELIDYLSSVVSKEAANIILNRATGVYKGNLPSNVQIWTVDGIIVR